MKKRSRKLLALLLVLAMVFGMTSVTSFAESGQSSVAVQSDEEATAAPAPKFDSWANLSHDSTTYYAPENPDIRELYIQIKTDSSSYTVDTLTGAWQVSDDGENFTDIEGAATTFESNLYIRYAPEIKAGETKYYRVAVTNKGLTEGMTPTTVYSAVAKIVYNAKERPGLLIEKPMLRQSDGTLVSDETVSKIQTFAGGTNSLPRKSANFGNFTGNIVTFNESGWDTDKYAFVGWQFGDTFYSGISDEEHAGSAAPTETNGWKGMLNGDDWYLTMFRDEYRQNYEYNLQFAGNASGGMDTVISVIPVFEAKPDMAYKITVVDTTGGTVKQTRGDGESHILRATAEDLYQFSH